jgi:hypothetical protein
MYINVSQVSNTCMQQAHVSFITQFLTKKKKDLCGHICQGRDYLSRLTSWRDFSAHFVCGKKSPFFIQQLSWKNIAYKDSKTYLYLVGLLYIIITHKKTSVFFSFELKLSAHMSPRSWWTELNWTGCVNQSITKCCGVSHFVLAILHLKKYLIAKEELWKLNYNISQCKKYNLPKNPLKERNQNPSRYIL